MSSWEYVLEGDASHLSGVLGISNESHDADKQVKYEVADLVSKKVLQSGTAKYGTAVRLDCNIEGVTRVRFRGKVTSIEDEASTGFVVGDVTLS